MNAIVLASMAFLPVFTQNVATEWGSPDEAKAATAELVELDEGEKYLLACRWDDTNYNHRFLSKALSAAGLKYSAIVNKAPDEFAKVLREIVASGGSVGVHTLNHQYMSRLLPMKCFSEILQNRVLLELASQSPVVTFGAPFGQGAFGRNMRICGESCVNAGLLGGADGTDSAAMFGLPPDRWVGMYLFRANDSRPDKGTFSKGLKAGLGLVDSGKSPGGPVLALGVHPWQDEQGRADLAGFVKEALATTPGLVPVSQNSYVARRMQFLHSRVEKAGVEGKKAIFAVSRPRIRELGANEPLLLKLSDGRIVKVSAPDDEALPKSYSEVKGALTASADRKSFSYAYANTTGRALAAVEFILRLPPGYRPGVVRQTLRDVPAGFGTTLEFRSTPPDDPVAREGAFYAAMEVNFPGERAWTQLEIPASRARTECPRDCAAACGPFLKKAAPSDSSMCGMSAPGAELAGVGDCAWFLCDGSREGDAVWAVTACRKTDDRSRLHNRIGWKRLPEDQRLAYMLCHEFEIDTAAHGDEWTVAFSGGHVTKSNTRTFLNGAPTALKEAGARLRNGRNRLLVYLFDLDPNMLYTTFEVKSARDGAVAKSLQTVRIQQ